MIMSRGIKRLLIGLAGCLMMVGGRSCPSTADDHGVPAIQVLTPEQILGVFWNHFLGALRSGNDKAIRSECTGPGFQSLIVRLDPHHPRAAQWRQWGQDWSRWGMVRWGPVTAIAAYGRLGPKDKEHSVTLVLTPQGWKLDHWSPPD